MKKTIELLDYHGIKVINNKISKSEVSKAIRVIAGMPVEEFKVKASNVDGILYVLRCVTSSGSAQKGEYFAGGFFSPDLDRAKAYRTLPAARSAIQGWGYKKGKWEIVELMITKKLGDVIQEFDVEY